MAYGPERVEGFEAAASLGISINRAVLDKGESITLTARPLFSLGHSLVGTYTARSWLESRSGIVSGTERRRTVRGLEPIAFESPVDTLGDGIVAVGHRLESLSGETSAEFRYAVVVARDASLRLERLESALATLESGDAGASRTSSRVAALETLRHHTRALEAERLRFDGPWQRRAHPFGVYWSTVNSRAMGRTAMEVPQFAGPIRFAEDVALAESLAIALVGGTAALHPSGDTQQAYLTVSSFAIDSSFRRATILAARIRSSWPSTRVLAPGPTSIGRPSDRVAPAASWSGWPRSEATSSRAPAGARELSETSCRSGGRPTCSPSSSASRVSTQSTPGAFS